MDIPSRDLLSLLLKLMSVEGCETVLDLANRIKLSAIGRDDLVCMTRCWRETDSNPRSLRREQHFTRPPGNPATTNRPDGQNWILTIDEGRFTVRLSQAGPGNDINAGSPGSQKAPTWGPASLVVIRALAGRCAAMASCGRRYAGHRDNQVRQFRR